MAISSRIVTFLACVGAVVSAPTFAETITVGGVGSLTPLVQKLAEDYSKKTPGVEIVVVSPPLGTKGGIRALAAGKVDILLSGRELKSDEAAQRVPWVKTALVLATNGGKSKGFTSAQLANIYAGRQKNWDDNKPIRLVLRGEQESETRDLRSMSPELDAAVATALKRSDLPIAENDLDALDSLTKIPGSFGTTSQGLLTASGARLSIVPVDGLKPSGKGIEDGSYPWLRHYTLGTSKAPSPAATAFFAWLNSAPALAAARKFDYVPAK
jgi:phosphate transport system substrate-binding protein